MNRLLGKVALITGGTSGMGLACANLFAREGAKVLVTGRDKERGKKITETAARNGADISFFPCDVSNEQDVKNVMDYLIQKYGRLDILFNNAGVMLPSMEIERMPVADWKQTLDINLTGCFLMSRYAKPYLVQTKGNIVNNASIAGLQHYAVGRSYAYSASKAAVIQFSHQMAKNYAPEGVRVNCICPGIILTPILHGRDPKIYEERIPLGRIGMPEDVAKVVLFLVSDDAAYLTGVVLPIDGGVSL
ncbi:MAG: SDR family NAD(P)-dependent oxidoreductase [Elusimicrobia bacterium]|nr:SDR family NAD(P)-dependent oxidoreductase [Elusimicrobiota bacterium]